MKIHVGILFALCSFAAQAEAASARKSPARAAPARPSHGGSGVREEAPQPKREERRNPAPVGAKETPRSVSVANFSARPSTVGVGLALGSNAIFGNALTVHFQPLPYFEVRGGGGYNTTGGKFGAGAALVLPIGPAGFQLGGAFVHSTGNKDKVSVPAKFTPEGASSAESLNAIRRYRVSPANYYTIFGAGYLNFGGALRLELAVNRNKVTSGNEVEFQGEIEYDQPIDPLNEDEVQPRFEAKAREKLDTNGVGFSVGLQLWL